MPLRVISCGPSGAKLCVEATDKKRALLGSMPQAQREPREEGGGKHPGSPEAGTVICCTAEIKDQTLLPSI